MIETHTQNITNKRHVSHLKILKMKLNATLGGQTVILGKITSVMGKDSIVVATG